MLGFLRFILLEMFLFVRSLGLLRFVPINICVCFFREVVSFLELVQQIRVVDGVRSDKTELILGKTKSEIVQYLKSYNWRRDSFL